MATDIKINLTTYLKDAGIRATKEQVDKLQKSIRDVNKQAQVETDKTAMQLGKMPGIMGKIQQATSGAFAKGLAVVGAFKMGCDIGEWIYTKVIRPLAGIKDPIEELKRKNREIKKQAEEAATAWGEAFAAWEASWNKITNGAEKAKTAIEDATQAYLKMQQARERVNAAGDDAVMLGMEREKFNAMAGAATPEDAAAIGKYHDVLMAEAQAKKDMAKFDRAANTELQKMEMAEEALLRARDKSAALKRQMVELDKQIAQMETQDSVRKYGLDKAADEVDRLNGEKKQLQQRLDAANRDVRRRQDDREAARMSASALAQERENAQARAELDVEQKKQAYDEYVTHLAEQEEKAAQDAWQRQQEAIEKEIATEQAAREQMERELAQQRIADIRSELAVAQREQNAANTRAAAADAGMATAWRMYRDKNAMQAQIDEFKAQRAAEAQWQKDFERLKFRRTDWRTAEFGSMSAADEAVRQVALAKEEKAAADKAVLETAENTKELADKLDQLLMIK